MSGCWYFDCNHINHCMSPRESPNREWRQEPGPGPGAALVASSLARDIGVNLGHINIPTRYLNNLRPLTFICPQDHPVAVLHDAEHPELDVGQRHLLPVHLDPHLLQEAHLGRPEPHRDRPQPGEGQRVPGVVGDPDGEGGVDAGGRLLAAVTGQEVLARALEVEDLAVECLVVRVSEHSAHSLRRRAQHVAGGHVRRRGQLGHV